MFHKVKEIKPMKKYVLLATFHDDTVKSYDVEPLFEKIKVFCALRDVQGLFEQVKVDVGGYGISWNDELDLACDELWYNGVEVPHADKELVSAFSERR